MNCILRIKSIQQRFSLTNLSIDSFVDLSNQRLISTSIRKEWILFLSTTKRSSLNEFVWIYRLMANADYYDYEYDDANLTDAEYEDLVRATLWPQNVEKTFVVVLMCMMVVGIIGNTLVVVVIIFDFRILLQIIYDLRILL
ncbi:hypothetical protein DICVIV_00425 [Dictyocaulus viviparus]|uniref:Uncharacterized protein n=1 Tax=Dictyocaulus viviparus TaxID=29172 RepID=A0A0D8YAT9_DICVI|nr:hypothetical protein DICVIV_00425 [Dictyocaulus viviparus]